MKTGDRVIKTGGTFEATGTVVAAFKNVQGEDRYVMEFDNPKGMLHIYTAAQLRPAGEARSAELSKLMADIKAFHEKYDLAYDGPPRELSDDVRGFRFKFLQEELEEYRQALLDRDLEGQLDALVDLVYVALGSAYLAGLPFDAGWDEVQAANMRKVKAGPNGEGSKRGSPHDVVKPAGWVGPDIAKVLREARSS